MKVRISRPIYYIDSWDVHGDVKKFYDRLPEILTEMNIEHDVLRLGHNSSRTKIVRDENTLCLAWHLHGNLPDVWHLKNAYLPDYFYFDKHGYSGLSDLAQEYEYDVDIKVYYIRNNIYYEGERRNVNLNPGSNDPVIIELRQIR